MLCYCAQNGPVRSLGPFPVDVPEEPVRRSVRWELTFSPGLKHRILSVFGSSLRYEGHGIRVSGR